MILLHVMCLFSGLFISIIVLKYTWHAAWCAPVYRFIFALYGFASYFCKTMRKTWERAKSRKRGLFCFQRFQSTVLCALGPVMHTSWRHLPHGSQETLTTGRGQGKIHTPEDMV